MIWRMVVSVVMVIGRGRVGGIRGFGGIFYRWFRDGFFGSYLRLEYGLIEIGFARI